MSQSTMKRNQKLEPNEENYDLFRDLFDLEQKKLSIIEYKSQPTI